MLLITQGDSLSQMHFCKVKLKSEETLKMNATENPCPLPLCQLCLKVVLIFFNKRA